MILDALQEFLNWGIYILIASLAVIILLLIIFIIYFEKKNKKPNKKVIDKNELFIALGDKDNIIDIKITGSRLTITFKNKDVINTEQLKELGFLNYILLSNKITFTLDEENKKYIKNILD